MTSGHVGVQRAAMDLVEEGVVFVESEDVADAVCRLVGSSLDDDESVSSARFGARYRVAIAQEKTPDADEAPGADR